MTVSRFGMMTWCLQTDGPRWSCLWLSSTPETRNALCFSTCATVVRIRMWLILNQAIIVEICISCCSIETLLCSSWTILKSNLSLPVQSGSYSSPRCPLVSLPDPMPFIKSASPMTISPLPLIVARSKSRFSNCWSALPEKEGRCFKRIGFNCFQIPCYSVPSATTY